MHTIDTYYVSTYDWIITNLVPKSGYKMYINYNAPDPILIQLYTNTNKVPSTLLPVRIYYILSIIYIICEWFHGKIIPSRWFLHQWYWYNIITRPNTCIMHIIVIFCCRVYIICKIYVYTIFCNFFPRKHRSIVSVNDIQRLELIYTPN